MSSARDVLLSTDSAPAQEPMAASAPSGAAAQQALNIDEEMARQEHSPAYRALHEAHLISNQYRVRRVEDLDLVRGNASMAYSTVLKAASCNGCCCLASFFEVNAGCVRKGTHSDGSYLLFGEGVHVQISPFISVESQDIPLTTDSVIHGTKAIVMVDQGFVGLAMDRGQPLLLPPGMHQWDSPTLEFNEIIDLATSLIKLGPYTLVTVDEGYSAVTQDNGKQKILEGGRAYMLTHRNWKFEKFITQKLQTNDVGPLTVTSGDNVPLETTATVNWVIEDVTLAARMAANTMQHTAVQSGGQRVGPTLEFDISKIRSDVLRQVTASLAAFIGSVSYSAHGNQMLSKKVGGAGTKAGAKSVAAAVDNEKGGAKALFDREQLNSSVEHANDICGQYGVKILTINLISAFPSDRSLLEALSQGAVATVAAEQTATAARGEAQALLVKARAEAEADRIRAEGAAMAEELRAEGSLKAANRLESSAVAVELAKMRTAGNCLGEGNANSFFFGLGGPADIPAGVLGSSLVAVNAAADKK
eukprot:TRINITY_DN1968_c0_g1_i5.p1 TRINITY_DN1968_c0_g1~~TRINITY_DN1968_c0_g1_i5.p1  ORF type:complete len:532 (+),score=85.69 TRINITY_DN1968_c0_g1_i5:55-1650(+)